MPFRGAGSDGGVPVFDPSLIPAAAATTGPSLVLDKGNPFAGSPLGSPNRPGVTAPRNVVDLDSGIAHWFSLSDGERESFAERAYKAGLIQDQNDYSQVQNAWQAAVTQAAGFYTYGKREVTPWEAVDLMAGITPGGGRQSLAGTKTAVQRQVDIPSKTTMRAGLKAVFEQELGRAPNADELDRYSSMFVKAAKANPTVARTTTTYDDQGRAVNSSSTQSGGFSSTDMQQLATEKTQDSQEWGSFQAATTYSNALMRAIGL